MCDAAAMMLGASGDQRLRSWSPVVLVGKDSTSSPVGEILGSCLSRNMQTGLPPRACRLWFPEGGGPYLYAKRPSWSTGAGCRLGSGRVESSRVESSRGLSRREVVVSWTRLALGMPRLSLTAYGSLSSSPRSRLVWFVPGAGGYPVARSGPATQRCLGAPAGSFLSLRVRAGPSQSCCRRCATKVTLFWPAKSSVRRSTRSQRVPPGRQGPSEYTVGQRCSQKAS